MINWPRLGSPWAKLKITPLFVGDAYIIPCGVWYKRGESICGVLLLVFADDFVGAEVVDGVDVDVDDWTVDEGVVFVCVVEAIDWRGGGFVLGFTIGVDEGSMNSCSWTSPASPSLLSDEQSAGDIFSSLESSSLML